MIRSNYLISNDAGERCAVRMNQREVRALFALRLVDRPNPTALVGQQFSLSIKNQVAVR